MKKIGLTGGIGAGKSYVAKILKLMSYPVFNSDVTAKEIMNTDAEVVEILTKRYGDECYENGTLNRPFLAKIIFSNEEEKKFINALIHPKVRQAFDDFAQKQSQKLVFNEAAILFETGMYKKFDATLLVTAPKKLRIERVMKRDGASREQIEARMNNQWEEAKKRELADFVLVNDEKQSILLQLNTILNQLSQLPCSR